LATALLGDRLRRFHVGLLLLAPASRRGFSCRTIAVLRPLLYNVSGVPPNVPKAPPGTLRPRLRLPCTTCLPGPSSAEASWAAQHRRCSSPFAACALRRAAPPATLAQRPTLN